MRYSILNANLGKCSGPCVTALCWDRCSQVLSLKNVFLSCVWVTVSCITIAFVNTQSVILTVCFPYTFLIGEYLESTKEIWDNLPVFHLPVVCLPSHRPRQWTWLIHQQQSGGCHTTHWWACSVAFIVTSVDDIRQWGCRVKHYIHIKSSPSVPAAMPCDLKSRILVADIKASEALDGPGCCRLRAEQDGLAGHWALGFFEAFSM